MYEAPEPQSEAAFICEHASRVVKLGTLCVMSFGLTEGLNDALISELETEHLDDWRQAAAGFQNGTLTTTVVNLCALLDRNPPNRDQGIVSFQEIRRRLKSHEVCAALQERLAARYGDDLMPPTYADRLSAFLEAYSAINWESHGRLMHLRNLGFAHLTVERMKRSVTFGQIKDLVLVVGQLTAALQQLCRTETAFRQDYLSDYREMGNRAILRGRPPL